MENSDSETGVFDWSVGTIVWVRRRNGSWWPGKILGPDELSASHVMSPRSGTPVKLLGREDASVDWYNLEKSKRVKPFRCGEFDDCIEKAEASHGLPPKKREKYARREDAILHALELEKQLNEKKHGKGDLLSDFNGTKLPDAVGKEAATSPHRSRYGNGKHVKSGRTSKGLGSGTEEKKKGHRGKEGNHSMDDDSSGGQPRMRGLQDLGLRPATSKQKHSSLVMSNGLHKHALEDGFHGPIDGGGLTTENMTNADPKDVLDKRKRSQDVEEPLGKRRDKRRPLVQVLESSAKLQPTHSLQPQVDGKRITPIMLAEEVTGDMRQANKRENVDIPVKSEGNLDDKEIIPEPMKISAPKFEDHTHASPADGSEENTSGSTEDTETDTSGTDSLEVGADDVMTALSDEAAAIELIPKSLGRSESQQEHGIMSNEEHDDLGLPGDMSPNQLVAANVTMSKWQLKGKRNNRSSTKRYRSMSDRKFSKGVSHGMHPKEEGNYGGGYCYDDADPVDKNLTCMVGYGSRGLDSGRDITNWEDLSRDDQPALRGCWEDSAEYYEPVFVGRHFGGRVKSMLIDVDLKVQSSYQREHVPMISLMSKLNGKAIVGHPIPVETLENGSSDILLSLADDFQNPTPFSHTKNTHTNHAQTMVKMSLSSGSSVLLLLILAAFVSAKKTADVTELQIGVKYKPEHCAVQAHKGDRIKVHYRGTLTDGTVFDSSFERGDPIEFELGSGQVIKGWDQGLLGMCVGEKRKLKIPSKLGYGDQGSPPKIPGGATLIFETVLVQVNGKGSNEGESDDSEL